MKIYDDSLRYNSVYCQFLFIGATQFHKKKKQLYYYKGKQKCNLV